MTSWWCKWLTGQFIRWPGTQLSSMFFVLLRLNASNLSDISKWAPKQTCCRIVGVFNQSHVNVARSLCFVYAACVCCLNVNNQGLQISGLCILSCLASDFTAALCSGTELRAYPDSAAGHTASAHVSSLKQHLNTSDPLQCCDTSSVPLTH